MLLNSSDRLSTARHDRRYVAALLDLLTLTAPATAAGKRQSAALWACRAHGMAATREALYAGVRQAPGRTVRPRTYEGGPHVPGLAGSRPGTSPRAASDQRTTSD